MQRNLDRFSLLTDCTGKVFEWPKVAIGHPSHSPSPNYSSRPAAAPPPCSCIPTLTDLNKQCAKWRGYKWKQEVTLAMGAQFREQDSKYCKTGQKSHFPFFDMLRNPPLSSIKLLKLISCLLFKI